MSVSRLIQRKKAAQSSRPGAAPRVGGDDEGLCLSLFGLERLEKAADFRVEGLRSSGGVGSCVWFCERKGVVEKPFRGTLYFKIPVTMILYF